MLAKMLAEMLAKCSKTAEVLLHPELEHHDYIAQRVCDYVGRSMLELLLSEQSFSKLLHVSKKLMINLVSIVSKICTSSKDADLVVRFLTEWAQVRVFFADTSALSASQETTGNMSSK